MKNKNLFDPALLDAMSSSPVSYQIDEVFKTVLKEKTKVLSHSSQLNHLSLVQNQGGLNLNEKKDSIAVSEKEEFSLIDENLLFNETPEAIEEIPKEKFSAKEDLEKNTHSSLKTENSAFQEDNSDHSTDTFDLGSNEIMVNGDELTFTSLVVEEKHDPTEVKNTDRPVDLELLTPSSVSSTKLDSNALSLDENILDLDSVPNLAEPAEDLNHIEFKQESVELNYQKNIKNNGELSSINLLVDDSLSVPSLDENFLDSGLKENEDEIDDLSDDAKRKLEEIDEMLGLEKNHPSMMKNDHEFEDVENNPSFFIEEQDDSESGEQEKQNLKPKEIPRKSSVTSTSSESFKDVSKAYNGEIERLQATLSNLRADREELLHKLQKAEDDKILQSRQVLSLRAELDEKKIELTIIRKKLNEEINNLKDSHLINEERRLILEEKNKLLNHELEKLKQKSKIDLKNIQMRERDLEQKFELLKSDADVQIKNRDHKILELKRKIDAMEFDMESIALQEKKSVESRFELEDKLEKAIKTLKSAISSLEDDADHSNAINNLKKNIDL